MVYAGSLYRGNFFFTSCHAIGASVETGDYKIIDKQGAHKLLAALKM